MGRAIHQSEVRAPRILHVDQGLVVDLDPLFIAQLLERMGDP